MARILACADLFFGSKIEATLAAAGHEVEVTSLDSRAERKGASRADLVVLDLDALEREGSGRPVGLPQGVPVLAYYSHVEAQTRRRGEEAGYELVVPRSRMAREMPALVARLLG